MAYLPEEYRTGTLSKEYQEVADRNEGRIEWKNGRPFFKNSDTDASYLFMYPTSFSAERISQESNQ